MSPLPPRPRVLARTVAGAALLTCLATACSDRSSTSPPKPPPTLLPSPFHDPAVVALAREGLPDTPRRAFAGDLDGDGDADLIVATGAGTVLFSMHDTGFAGAPVHVPEVDVVAVEDVDGDGFADLISETAIVYALPDGVLHREPLPVVVNARPLPLDVDGDGDLDLLLASRDATPSLLLVQGPPRHFTVEPGPRYGYVVAAVAGDVDGDGIDDVVSSARPPGSDGIHAVCTRRPGGWDVRDIAVPDRWRRGLVQGLLDHDRDGDLDLLYTASSQPLPPGGGVRPPAAVSIAESVMTGWLANDGNGNFGDIVELREGFDVVVGIGDADGLPGDEVVGWRIAGQGVVHVPELGGRGRQLAVHEAIGKRLPLGFFDLDGDGDGEIVTVAADGRPAVFWGVAHQLVIRDAGAHAIELGMLWRSPAVPVASSIAIDVRRADEPILLPGGGRLFVDPARALILPLPHDAVRVIDVPPGLRRLWVQSVFATDRVRAGNIVSRAFAAPDRTR